MSRTGGTTLTVNEAIGSDGSKWKAPELPASGGVEWPYGNRQVQGWTKLGG